MKRRSIVTLLGAFAVLCCTAVSAAAMTAQVHTGATAAAAATAAERTVIFNLEPNPLVKPSRIFFSADAGPYLKDLHWSGWGTSRAIGTGTYELDCSGGGPDCGASTAVTTYTATYTLSRLGACPRFGADTDSYETGTVAIDKPGHTFHKSFASPYDLCAKRPTLAAARQDVAHYVKEHFHARAITVGCQVEDAVSLGCNAAWTAAGHRKKESFIVSAGTTRRPLTGIDITPSNY